VAPALSIFPFEAMMRVFFTVLMSVPLVTFAKVDTQVLSKKVIELRQEVELLNDEYKTEREKVLSELKALSIQKAELAANIRNEEIRKKQLDDKVAQLKKELGASSIESEALEPVLQRTLQDLEKWVQQSLPFKQKERLASLDQLRQRLAKREVSPVKGANELWALIEDEKRLARETSLHKQSLPINGQLHLAEVVKLGMLFLYFKTEQGDVGMAVSEQGQWTYKIFQQASQQKQTLAFFQSLKKQIRQGFFQIPTQI
jgi:uncharacterized protein YlxW (UPF0749 family)